ncbi:FAD:protein FMN transferase [Marinifilum sp. D737]|jgi:thiamine biosynthesis lipoprotein|uniref:FAD:protein FMN transferase n=1 Tax=Marinifilum sp. D737 TaxID=2969628 RepID=UPI002274E231|nr:FAD:protein FMN transferase [Marinifilum sp. D737]MCY1633067.1 FAD:protein FMN transferase [Marinifilum sp. D737]
MNKLKYISLFVLLIVFGACEQEPKYHFNEGKVFGTFYHMVYQYPNENGLQAEILEKLKEFDFSLSTYNPESVISKVNQNDSTVVLDDYFTTCFKTSEQIAKVTEGAFDWTVAPLVNAWGFGFKNKLEPEEIPVDSLLQVVGYQKVRLEAGKVIKEDPRIMFDASAIAKGYGVDVVADFLESKGITNYMVEIGGEIRAKGNSNKNRPWRVGIDKPIDDPTSLSRQIQDVLELKNGAMATSGNYRQFYVKDGKKYAHTIDPRLGYPVQHSLLSASVVAPTCMKADAYATAFMVLGLEKSVEIVQNDPELDAYFIYTDEKGALASFTSEKLKSQILK